MRISDWSSDVCSSDLVHHQERRNRTLRQRIDEADAGQGPQKRRLPEEVEAFAYVTRNSGSRLLRRLRSHRQRGSERGHDQPGDRKRVVYEKGLAVRVDHGGLRYIQNKAKER